MTTTPPDARNALAEIVAGLDGVTPGPWLVREYSHRPSGAGSGLRMVWDTDRRNMCLECVPAPVAHHIARLDPTTIRSIADYVAALEAQVEGMRVENAKLKTMLSGCDWYWPEDDTSSDACADGTWQIVENCDVKPGEVFGYSRGGVVETRYYGYLEAADDADSDDQFEADEPTREAAEAKISAELQRRAALQSSETTGEQP